MEIKKLSTAILVLAMTAAMVSLSTTAAGTHTPTVEISPMYAATKVTTLYTLTVTNTSGDPINNVRIELPEGFSGPKNLVRLPEGSEVELLGENFVTLPACTEAKITLDNEITLPEFGTVLLPEDDMIYISGVAEHVISNESFETSTVSWSFVAATGTPTGSWDPAGWKDGCAKIASETGANMDGEGYWKQTFAVTIAPASTVTLSYAWKKDYAAVAPDQQDIYVIIKKPDTTTVTIDNYFGVPAKYDFWYKINKDVTAFFDQDGTYVIRLRYDYKTGADASAQALVWFDEVKILVTPPPFAKYLLLDDERAELVSTVVTTLPENTRVELLLDSGGYLADDSLILLADTPISLIDYTVLEDTGAKLPAESTAKLKGDTQISLLEGTSAILPDNHVRLVGDTYVFQLEPVAGYTTLPEDTAVELEENEVILGRGAEAEFAENNTITLPEDTAITIGAGTTVSLPPATVANIIQMPEGWNSVVDNVANTITWTGTGGNAIAAGQSESFLFSAQTPDITDVENTYSWAIVTTDTVGQSEDSTFDTIVDGKKPAIDAVYINDSTSAYVPAGVPATVKIVMENNEMAGDMGRVLVLTRYVIMSTTDNITWTGTITPGTWDEEAPFVKVWGYTDIVGNQGDVFYSSLFYVDSRAPIPENVLFSGEAELPENTDVKQWLITGVAVDNQPPAPRSLTIYALVNEVVQDNWVTRYPYTDNSFELYITLEGGYNFIEVRVVDSAGNVGRVYNWTILKYDVDVSISPISQFGVHEGTLTYTVTVTNMGTEEDNYILTVIDEEEWGPTVSPDSLTIAPETSDTATVSITIPETATIGDVDVITVTATGAGVSDNASSTATVMPVSVSISPSSKMGTAGDNLTYTVTVNNIGEDDDTYDLTVTDNASPSWTPSLDNTTLSVAADETETTTLCVTIPIGTIFGAQTTMTVTATSATDSTISSSATCTATVEIPPQVQTVSIEFIPGGENRVADFTPYGIPVLEVTITVETLENDVVVAVEELEGVEVPAPPGVVHYYVNITTNITHANIRGLLTKFRVSRSWVVQNDIDEDTIKLLEFYDDQWQELSTSHVGPDDENYLYYAAEGQGFSLYAVTGQEAGAPPPSPTPEGEAPPSEVPLGILVGAVVIVVVLVVLYSWMRRR